MGERADDVVGSDPVGESREAARPTQSDHVPVTDADMEGASGGTVRETISREDEEIAAARADIEETRAEMSETIDAIGEKLSPEHLTEQARESVNQAGVGKARRALETARGTAAERAGTVTSTARGAGSAVSQRVKQQPLPLAAAGVSLAGLAAGAWLIREQRQRATQTPRKRAAAQANEAINRVQLAAGQFVGQAQGAATRLAARGPGTEPRGQAGVLTPGPPWLLFDAPVTAGELIAGAGLVVLLAVLRRLRRAA